MLNAYLDEKGIHAGAALCLVAGYFGEKSQFAKFGIHWKEILKETGIPLGAFHPENFLTNLAKYGNVLEKLALAIGEYEIYPICCSILVADFNSFSLVQRMFMTGARMNGNKFISSGCPSKPYFVPFQRCIERLGSYAPIGSRVHFFFGLDKPIAEYANGLLAQIKHDPVSPHRERLGMPSFPLVKETPPLQAADLLAQLTYQDTLERFSSKTQNEGPTGLLAACLRRLRVREDFSHYNQELLQLILERELK